MLRPRTRSARLLAVALVLAALIGGVLLLGRGGRTSGSTGRDSVSAERDRADSELQDPGESDARTPPKPTELPPSKRSTETPARPVLQGLVVDDATGAPIDSFELLCTPAGADRQFVDTILGMESATEAASVAFTGARGRFAITVLDVETQSVCAFAAGYERSEPVTAGAGDDIEIRLKRGGIVRGRVVDPATGNPVEGALVAWLDRQGKARTGPRERFERTDALGRFVLGSVPLSARAVLAGDERLGEGMSPPLGLTSEAPEREIVVEVRRSGG